MEQNGVGNRPNEALEGQGAFQMESLGRCLSSFVDEGSQESHRYYLSRRIVLEMLKDRGYSVPRSEIDTSLQEFRALHGQQPDIDRLKFSASHMSDPSKRIVNRESLTGLILVLQNQMTSQALKAVEMFSFKVEMFQSGRGLSKHDQLQSVENYFTAPTVNFSNMITDLLINITKHVLKPKHRILSEQEKQKLLKKYSIEEKQLPRLLKNDAIARYYGLEKGQVVKVTSTGEITESHVSYRCVW